MRLRHTLGAASAAAALSLSFAAQPAAAACDVAVRVDGRFAPPKGSAPYKAVTYAPAGMPVGARVAIVELLPHEGGTRFKLRLSGARPDHTYGVHVHRMPCGARPEDSGPHYQDRPDPHQPSTDPAYANPRNEVWLDLTTDHRGDGHSATRVAWHFRPGEARSLVFHEQATATDPGHAGTAGARLACVGVPFEPAG